MQIIFKVILNVWLLFEIIFNILVINAFLILFWFTETLYISDAC